MRLLSFFYFIVIGAVIASSDSLAESSSADAGGAPTYRPANFQKSGIRFQINASIMADPTSSYAKQAESRNTATLDVKIRISAHATESQFFGEITKTFEDFRPNEGSVDLPFWHDAKCHQRRGLPKTTVTAIDGSIATTNGNVKISARPRHLGMLLPSDEISAGTRLPDGADENGNFIASRSQTKLSRLFVDVKVYVIDCDLTVGAPPIIPANGQPR